jgi:hypothetical protein
MLATPLGPIDVAVGETAGAQFRGGLYAAVPRGHVDPRADARLGGADQLLNAAYLLVLGVIGIGVARRRMAGLLLI